MATDLAGLAEMLKKLQTGDIYLMADKRWIVEGFALASKTSAVNLVWDGVNSLLRMTIERFLVVVHEKEGRLRTACNCPAWTSDKNCPHTVCAIVTLKKTVSPESIPNINFPQRYSNYLRESLELDKSKREAELARLTEESRAKRSRVCLVVEKRDDEGLDISIKKNGVTLYAYSTEMPAELRDLWMISYGNDRELIIEELFRRFKDRYPVIFKDGTKETSMTFDLVSRHTLHSIMDGSGERIVLSLSPDGQEGNGDGVFISRHYLFDLKKGVIGRIEDGTAWEFWNMTAGLIADLEDAGRISAKREGQRIVLSRRDFNKIQIRIGTNEAGRFMKYCRLCVGGKRSELALAPVPSYWLHAKEVANGQVKVVAKGLVGKTEFDISPDSFMILTSHVVEQVSTTLRAKKRLKAIYDSFFSAVEMGSDREAEKEIRERINSDDFPTGKVVREGVDLLKHFVKKGRKPSNILMFKDKGWTMVPADTKLQARALSILFRIFGVEIFMESPSPGAITVSKAVFMESLPELYRGLSGIGVGLTYEDRPVSTVRWEFEIDAQRSSIDWFEIRPEIRCEGEAVDQAEFEKALASDGFYDDGKSLKLLDEESMRILSMVGEIKKGEKGRKEEAEIVRIPRLQILDWLALRREGVKVRLSKEDERIMESLLSFNSIPERPLPEKLNAKLRHYQSDGYNWLAFLYEHRFGACLADDMGLGKTLQAITFMAGLKEGKIKARLKDRPHLIVVPPSLLFNWEHEIEKFYPDLKSVIYQGKDRNTDFSGVDVVISSYEIVRRDIERLKDIEFHLIVFDEAQAVKNIQALTTSAVRTLNGAFRLSITGTPVENHIGEYYSIMDLAVPGLLGDIETLGAGKRKESVAEVNKVVRRTRPFVLRRTKQLIADELPPRIETDIYLDLSPDQKALYNRVVAEIKETVDEAYRTKTAAQARIIALTAILKLRQICLSPGLLLPEKKEVSPKIDFLLEQLVELKDEGHSCLVFSQFTSFLDIVEEEMKRSGMLSFRLDGSTPVAKRKNMVVEFQSSEEPSVFLISLKAGGKGLNLTRATYVFHLDPWWNPAVENQASDRAHRIGQRSTVTVTRLIMRHTVEEKMMVLKEKKSKLYKALLEEGEGGDGLSISKEDFDFLLGD